MICALVALMAAVIVILSGLLWYRSPHQCSIGKNNPDHILTPSISNALQDLKRYQDQRVPDMVFGDIRAVIAGTLTNGVQGHFGLYLEDLRTGSNLGINENDYFRPWSQLKVCVLVTMLKKIEQGRLSLNDRIPIQSLTSTPLTAPCTLTIEELMEKMIEESDNQASFALSMSFTAAEFQETLMAMGLPSAPPDKPKTQLPDITAKQYANVLRSLYYASYLRKPYCNLTLALMSNTKFGSQIQSGIPPDIPVAHKVGFNADAGDFSDSGIVYLPHAPYVLCIMCSHSTREESDRVIRAISRQVYEHMRSRTGVFARFASFP